MSIVSKRVIDAYANVLLFVNILTHEGLVLRKNLITGYSEDLFCHIPHRFGEMFDGFEWGSYVGVLIVYGCVVFFSCSWPITLLCFYIHS